MGMISQRGGAFSVHDIKGTHLITSDINIDPLVKVMSTTYFLIS